MSDKYVDKFNIMGLPIYVKDSKLTNDVNNTIIPDINEIKNRFPVNTNNIANNAVKTSNIADGAINYSKIAPDTITAAQMAQSEKIAIRSNSLSLKKNVILIGDSYVHSDHGRHAFDEVMPTIAKDWNVYSFSDSGCGFTFPGAQGYKMIDLVINAANSLGSEVYNVDYVIFCGGRNEAGGIASTSRPSDSLESVAEGTFSNAHANFPNAKVWFFPCLYDWRLPNSNLFKALSEMIYGASMQNVSIADGCWSWGTGNTELYLYPDDIHPNLMGSQMMCRKIYSAVENNNSNCFRDRQDNHDSIAFYLNKAGIQIVGEFIFGGNDNIMVSHANLPVWLQFRGGYNWYFAGYNTVANVTSATMVGLIPEGLTLAGGTVMPSGQKCRLCVNLPFTM